MLLLIFMATAPIITQSVEVDLPDATESQAVKSNDEPPVIVEVSGVGQYSVKVGPKRYRSCRRNRLLRKPGVDLRRMRKRCS